MTQQPDQKDSPPWAIWVVPVVVAVLTWVVWRLGVQTIVFAPDLTSTLLGLSIAANVGLVAYVVLSAR